MPFDSVAIIAGELVVEVVVALSEGYEGSNGMIARRVAVVKRLVTEPVCERVDTESGLLDEENPEDTGVDESSLPVTPSKPSNHRREDQSHEGNNPKVVLVLPDNNRVLVQIGDVGTTDSLRILFHDHPSNVRVQQTLADTVGVLVGVGISVMRTMIPGPPSD
jgi:hypothetical protein